MFFLSPLRWALRIPSMILTGAIVYVAVSGVQVIVASRQGVPASGAGPAAAIVVLPASLEGSAPSPDLLGRLEEARSLYRAGVAPKVLVAATSQASTSQVSGGSSATGPSPSAIARAWLVAQGVPAGSVVALHSTTAAQTLSAAAVLLAPPAKVVVVTDAMDALFTRGAAGADGLQAVVAPAVGSSAIALSDLGPLWRQATGVAVGRVIGYSRASWAGG